MFCKINNKYYVKVSNFYQELKVKNNNIVPTQGEKNRLYSPVSNCKVVSAEEILNAHKKETQKSSDKQKKDIRKIF